MQYGLYLEILLGCIPNNYIIEDKEEFYQGEAFLLLSTTTKDTKKYYVSLNFLSVSDVIGMLFMEDSTLKDYREMDKDFKFVSQYKIQELQAKVKEFLCTEMEKFIK